MILNAILHIFISITKTCFAEHCEISTYHLEMCRGYHCDIHETYVGGKSCDCNPPIILFTSQTTKIIFKTKGERWSKGDGAIKEEEGTYWSTLVMELEFRCLETEVDDSKPGISMLCPWARHFIRIAGRNWHNKRYDRI